MSQLNDEKLRGLRSALGVVNGGDIDSLELEYLHTILGAVSDNTADAWSEVFRDFFGYTEIHQFNAAAFNYLGALGHQQNTLDERWFSYWSAVV